PADIQRYPRMRYHDGYAYLVDGRWYFLAPEGWVTFRQEPRELARYRTQLVTPELQIGGYLVEPAPVPSDIRRWPHVPYRGSEVYGVQGRWYYPSAGGWVVFRQEPTDLVRPRREIETRSRPYQGYPPNYYGYPPPRR